MATFRLLLIAFGARYVYRRTIGRAVAALRREAEPHLTVRRWKQEGRPVPPPPEVKQRVLRSYAQQYGLRTFVETGTFLGDTTAALRPHVDHLLTIEISSELAGRARERFAGAPNVRILEGDSSRLLPEILVQLREPALFWLDGHYSGGITARGDVDTPVRTELLAILDHPIRKHVILIDDARDFTGGEYPTIAEVAETVRSHSSGYSFDLRDDIIRLTPPAERR
jgi:hypothetical protein